MKWHTLILLVVIATANVYGDNIQPIYITQQETPFTNLTIYVYNESGFLFTHSDISPTTRISAVTYMRGINSTYQQNVNYTLSLLQASGWVNVTNNTVGYLGRGDLPNATATTTNFTLPENLSVLRLSVGNASFAPQKGTINISGAPGVVMTLQAVNNSNTVFDTRIQMDTAPDLTNPYIAMRPQLFMNWTGNNTPVSAGLFFYNVRDTRNLTHTPGIGVDAIFAMGGTFNRWNTFETSYSTAFGQHVLKTGIFGVVDSGKYKMPQTHNVFNVDVSSTTASNPTWRVTSSNYDMDSAGQTMNYVKVGFDHMVRDTPTLTAGTLNHDHYGVRVDVDYTGAAGATTNIYGLYSKVAGFDNNYALYTDGGDWVMDDDSQNIYLGEAQDAGIFYDATDLIIEPDLVGSGVLRIGASVGTEDIWDGTHPSGTYAIAFGWTNPFGDITASNGGSIAMGYASAGSGQADLNATNLGSWAGGRVGAYDMYAKLLSEGEGSLAFGYVGGESASSTTIRATSYGSIALGNAYTTWIGPPPPPSSADILSSGRGSFAVGYAYNQNGDGATLIQSTGAGSVAMGYARDGTLQATGRGAVALGENVGATANNAITIGRAFTNAVADSFEVGFTDATLTVQDNQVDVTGELKVTDLVTGTNAGNTLCYDANNELCICGQCA